MRQVNFVVIFVICLALVLFAIENTEMSIVHFVKGVQVQAPLSVELIISMGIGAVFAWVFSVWTHVQQTVQMKAAMHDREVRIQELEQDIERYRVEIQDQRLLPGTSDHATDAEVIA